MLRSHTGLPRCWSDEPVVAMSFLLFVSFANRFFFAFLAFSPSFRSSACFVRSGTNSNSYLDLDFFEASQLTSSAGQARVKSGLFRFVLLMTVGRASSVHLFCFVEVFFLIFRFVCVYVSAPEIW